MMTRRRLVISNTVALLAASRSRTTAAAGPTTHASKALGTEVRLTLFDAPREVAERALAEVARVDRLLSLYIPVSQVCRLNRDGRLAGADPDLLAILRKCHALSERTSGAFDVTVQPLWELYARAKKAGKLPTDEELAAVRARVDYRKVHIDGDTVRLEPGMAVTLNAINQGFAADAAAAVLRRAGIRHAMIDAGEIATIGARPDGEPWTVGIQHPRREDAFIAVAKLRDQCLSTTGDYATTFSNDRAYHHIFNPATGKSPESFSSVTVVGPNADAADSLSTACFVVGVEKALKLVAATEGVEAMFVFKDGRTVATRGFPA